MFVSGAIAGLVGAIVVLGEQFRFIDGAALTPAYTWSGLMAALLAGGEPIGAILAGLFFAALQTGGFAMQRETSVPRVLTLVLQAIIILFLAVRNGLGRRSACERLHDALPHAIGRAGDHADPACRAAGRHLRAGRRLQPGAGRADADRRLRGDRGSYFRAGASAASRPRSRPCRFSLILAFGATVFRGDAVVIGIGMNLLASGLTAYLLRAGSTSAAPFPILPSWGSRGSASRRCKTFP